MSEPRYILLNPKERPRVGDEQFHFSVISAPHWEKIDQHHYCIMMGRPTEDRVIRRLINPEEVARECAKALEEVGGVIYDPGIRNSCVPSISEFLLPHIVAALEGKA